MYDYQTERPKLFTEDGQVMFLGIRDIAKSMIAKAGAARMNEIMQGTAGDSWVMLACVDRLVELGELREIKQEGYVPDQYRVFVAARLD